MLHLDFHDRNALDLCLYKYCHQNDKKWTSFVSVGVISTTSRYSTNVCTVRFIIACSGHVWKALEAARLTTARITHKATVVATGSVPRSAPGTNSMTAHLTSTGILIFCSHTASSKLADGTTWKGGIFKAERSFDAGRYARLSTCLCFCSRDRCDYFL